MITCKIIISNYVLLHYKESNIKKFKRIQAPRLFCVKTHSTATKESIQNSEVIIWNKRGIIIIIIFWNNNTKDRENPNYMEKGDAIILRLDYAKMKWVLLMNHNPFSSSSWEMRYFALSSSIYDIYFVISGMYTNFTACWCFREKKAKTSRI